MDSAHVRYAHHPHIHIYVRIHIRRNTLLFLLSYRYAARQGKQDIVEFLCTYVTKEDLNMEAKSKTEGHTAVLIAAHEGRVESLKVLINHGAQLDVLTLVMNSLCFLVFSCV